MKELILLCTKNVNFMFNGEMFTQVDSVAMGSPLAPILANIFTFLHFTFLLFVHTLTDFPFYI